MKRKVLVFIMSLALVITMMPGYLANAETSDTAGHWAAGSIKELTEKGIMKGYGDGKFLPDKETTREEVCAVLYAWMKGAEKKDSNFPDVKGRWSESAIAFLTEQGIVNGYPDRTFRPANRITREEFAKLLYGYLSKKIDFSGISGKNFSDTDGSWASEAISKLGGAGIIDGYQDGSFGKGKSLSRAELAKLITSADAATAKLPLNDSAKNKGKAGENPPVTNPGSSGGSNSGSSGGSSGGSGSGGSNLKKLENNRIVLSKLPAPDEPVADISLSEQYTTAEVTGTGKWQTEDTKFKPNTTYTLVIKLTAKSGYTLAGLKNDFFSVGNAVEDSARFNFTKSELTVKFQTGKIIRDKGFSASINDNNTLTLMRYEGDSADVLIPAKIHDRDVTDFDWGTFQDVRHITSVTFEDGNKIEKIEDHCFANCTGLKKLDIPEGIMAVGEKAFSGCTALEEISFPATLKRLDWHVLRNCENLSVARFKALTPPATLATKENFKTFSDMSNKTVIRIPVGADKPAYRAAFKDAGLLDAIEILFEGEPSANEMLVFEDNGDNTLKLTAYKGEEESLTVPAEYNGKRVVKIEAAFKGNKTLKTVELSEGIEVIGKNSFDGCKVLEKIVLPGSLKKIEDSGLSGTAALLELEFLGADVPEMGARSASVSSMRNYKKAKIIIPDGADLYAYGAALQKAGADPMIRIASKANAEQADSFRWIFGKDDFVSLHRFMDGDATECAIPDTYAGKNVKEIDKNCFIHARAVEQVTLPANLEKIGQDAFASRNKIKQIIIPATVKKIGDGAFNKCAYFDSGSNIGIVIIFSSAELPEIVDAKTTLTPDWEEVPADPSAFSEISDASVIYLPKGTSDEDIAKFKAHLVEKGGLKDSIEVRAMP